MSFCDWDPVVIDKRGKRGTGESKEAALTRALKSGTAVAEKKVEHAVGGAGVSAKKLDEDSDTFKRECARADGWNAAPHARVIHHTQQQNVEQRSPAACLSLAVSAIYF